MSKPIPSATLILLRDTAEGIETLLMRRHKQVKFLGGFWVFPGGAVEEPDLSDNEISTARRAAVRETLEEASVHIDESALLPISQWITPEGAPKRFSTWFFIARNSGHEVKVDGSEITESIWVKPAEAIARHRAQEIDMLPPTLISIIGLQDFSTVDEVLTHYHKREPLFFLPKAHFLQEQLVMLYPGDAGYETHETDDLSRQHRCIHTTTGWHYINEIKSMGQV
jgi:8-oxo-dGTP pyrophosphatase MutT (NUDIX family)